MDIPRTLVVTNDFPPRVGGIERVLHSLLAELPHDRVSVLAPFSDGHIRFDETEPYEVFRLPGDFLWPTPRLARRMDDVIAESGADVVLFGDVVPLAVLGPRLARRGTPYLVAAHGFAYWLSRLAGTHALIRYSTSMASRVPVMCSRFIAEFVRTAVPDRVPVSTLYPGADLDRFHPHVAGEEVRARLGLADRPVVVCVSRLVMRKGQDVLIRAMPAIRRRVPDAALLIVGGGPYRRRLASLAREAPAGSVVFAGEVRDADLPSYYAAGDVFAMPCRTRLGGLEVEGLGVVFLEAAACGKPVVVGSSGGAREAIVDGETGILVDGRNVREVAGAVSELLADRELAGTMGKAGRARIERSFTWPAMAARLGAWLREALA
jgi:phosphatidylinositol alpha-1,6-mannosyltransferase